MRWAQRFSGYDLFRKMISQDDIFKIGSITQVHGVGGEVIFYFTDDVFERAEIDYLFLEIEGLPVPFYIERYRLTANGRAIIKFEDVETADAAAEICGSDVYFPKSEIVENDTEPFSPAYLTGFKVFDEQAGYLGEVTAVNDSTTNILLSVRREKGGEVLIPLHEDFITECDEKERRLTLRLPDGLLTIND